MGCGGSRQGENVNEAGVTKLKLNYQSYFILESKKRVEDDYIVSNKLGQGEFGQIRRIINKQSREEKALKIIPKIMHSKEKETELNTEIEILKKLDHPSILKMYEYYQDSKNYYIVTEIIKGNDLIEKITQLYQFDETDAAIVFKQLISVIEYSHDHFVMHRDIKPENILLEYSKNLKEQFAIKVIDWGSAVSFKSNQTFNEELCDLQYRCNKHD